LQCAGPTSIASLSPIFSGKILTEENKGIDSAKVEVIAIDDVGHQSINNYIGKIHYTDENGTYQLDLPCGVEWKSNILTGNKDYTKYVKSATIKVSKASFKDTVVVLQNTNYEKSWLVQDIYLKYN
jgi:hypothetical protein